MGVGTDIRNVPHLRNQTGEHLQIPSSRYISRGSSSPAYHAESQVGIYSRFHLAGWSSTVNELILLLCYLIQPIHQLCSRG